MRFLTSLPHHHCCCCCRCFVCFFIPESHRKGKKLFLVFSTNNLSPIIYVLGINPRKIWRFITYYLRRLNEPRGMYTRTQYIYWVCIPQIGHAIWGRVYVDVGVGELTNLQRGHGRFFVEVFFFFPRSVRAECSRG